MFFKTIALLLFFASVALCQEKKFEWSQCDKPGNNPEGVVSFFDISPMPIRNPGSMRIQITVDALRDVNGALKIDTKISRKVGKANLPIRCYKVNGEFVGSCVFDDVCQLLNRANILKPSKCPKALVDIGIDCSCPFKLRKGRTELDFSIDIPDLKSSAINFLATGEFDVTVNISDPVGYIGCLSLKVAAAAN